MFRTRQTIAAPRQPHRPKRKAWVASEDGGLSAATRRHGNTENIKAAGLLLGPEAQKTVCAWSAQAGRQEGNMSGFHGGPPAVRLMEGPQCAPARRARQD